MPFLYTSEARLPMKCSSDNICLGLNGTETNCRNADISAIPIANSNNFQLFPLAPIFHCLFPVWYSYLLRFCLLSRAIRFVAFLMRNTLSKRTKATILFATETGRSERFAWNLAKVLSHIFDVKVRVFTL